MTKNKKPSQKDKMCILMTLRMRVNILLSDCVPSTIVYLKYNFSNIEINQLKVLTLFWSHLEMVFKKIVV